MYKISYLIRQLQLQCYVRAPHIKTRLSKDMTSFGELDSGKSLLSAVPCVIDMMSQTISSLTSQQPDKDGTRKMAEYESIDNTTLAFNLSLMSPFPIGPATNLRWGIPHGALRGGVGGTTNTTTNG